VAALVWELGRPAINGGGGRLGGGRLWGGEWAEAVRMGGGGALIHARGEEKGRGDAGDDGTAGKAARPARGGAGQKTRRSIAGKGVLELRCAIHEAVWTGRKRRMVRSSPGAR
jgi:hypothetical protein